MTMKPDGELLRNYAEGKAEEAFAELVRRHLNLVYSAALRQVNGDVHLAQDVAQTVFTDLARKAAGLAQRPFLAGWLYTSAHYAAAKVVRGEHRRQTREQEAQAMQALLQTSASETEWEQLRPVLDRVMHELKETDRAVILLRYFENRSFADIGQKLGLGEDAARKRTDRALEKMRGLLARRGIRTTAALGTVLSTQAVQMAPAGLAATLTGGALAGAAAGGGTALTFMKLITVTKLQAGVTAALVAAAAATTWMVQQPAQTQLRSENETLRRQMAQLQTQLQTDEAGLTNRPGQAGDSQKLTGAQLLELVQLRGEVGVLRQQADELGRLRGENQRLQTALRETRPPAAGAARPDAQPPETPGEAKMNLAKQGMLALIMFAADNGQQLPTSLAQTAPYLGARPNDGQTPVETNFDLVYQGSLTNLANPSGTIVLKEKQAWQRPDGLWEKVYGFADGHAESHGEPNGDFNAWERQRLVLPGAN